MSRRIPEIESIRGISSLIIVAGHICITRDWLFWYWGSLEIFFCVSGFVITRLLLDNLGQCGFLGNYFTRRVLRIWPMYFIAMAFAYAMTWMTAGSTLIPYGYVGDWRPSRAGFWLPMFFMQNTEMYFGIAREHYLTVFQHSWSIVVEEQFYALWPFLLLAVRRIPFVLRIFLAVLLIGLSAYLRGKGLNQWLLVTRLDGFVLGASLAFIDSAARAGRLNTLWLERIFRRLWIWPCLALVPYMTHGYFGLEWNFPAHLNGTVFSPNFNIALLTGALIGFCLFVPLPTDGLGLLRGTLRWKPLAYAGTISYSTYMLHPPIVFILSPLLISTYHLPSVFSWILGYGLTLALASVTHKWIEVPAMRLKKSFANTNGAAAKVDAKRESLEEQPLQTS